MGGGIAFELFTDWLAPPPRVEELYTYTPRTFPAIAVPSTRLFIFCERCLSRSMCADRGQQLWRPRYAANGFGRNRHDPRLFRFELEVELLQKLNLTSGCEFRRP